MTAWPQTDSSSSSASEMRWQGCKGERRRITSSLKKGGERGKVKKLSLEERFRLLLNNEQDGPKYRLNILVAE